MLRGRDGFTLVEALIVVLVIGILAALSVSTSAMLRHRSAAATMRSDLRNVASAQEAYYSNQQTYTSDVAALPIRLSPGVKVEINASAIGWTARATHEKAGNHACALAHGDIPPISPATGAGILVCEEQ